MDILLISTADWDNPYWTNKQHVAQELAQLGQRVLYIESLGLRRPTATGRDLKRILRRIRRALAAPRQVRPNLWVYSPLVLPTHGSPLAQRLNRAWLALQIGFWSRQLRLNLSCIWTYLPITSLLFDLRPYDVRVYHNVDNISAQPGMPSDIIRDAETLLLRHVDVVFTTSQQLQERSRSINPASIYLPNVADFDHFARALAPSTEIALDVAAIPSPRVGFVGAISSYKIDMTLLREAARLRPGLSFVLIGEIGEGDPLTETGLLNDLPNVHLLGGRSYASLPTYMKSFDVAMLPSLINDYTASMFPMKFFEYLAAGLPVVSTPLPALAEFGHVARFCPDTASFVDGIDQALAGTLGNLATRQSVAMEHTYRTRTRRMLELVDAARGTVDRGRVAPERNDR